MPNIDPNELDRLVNDLGKTPRARPKRDLMPGIKARIARPQLIVIPTRQWIGMVAAAVLLLFLNVTALTYYTSQSTGQDQTTALVSDYQLYE